MFELLFNFLKYETIETHTRAFFPLNISGVGSVDCASRPQRKSRFATEQKTTYRSRAGRHFYGTENEIWAGFGPIGNTEKNIVPPALKVALMKVRKQNINL